MYHIQSYNSLQIKRIKNEGEKRIKEENHMISYALDVFFLWVNAHFK